MSVEIRVKNKKERAIKVIELTEEEYRVLSWAVEDIDMYADKQEIIDSIKRKFST